MVARILQRFLFSNPSPRCVVSCLEAFKTGWYISGIETDGNGCGNLEATVTSIVLDRKGMNSEILSDPSHGSIREPMLKVTGLMRSMHYQTLIPTTLDGAPMQTMFNTMLWQIDTKIGHG